MTQIVFMLFLSIVGVAPSGAPVFTPSQIPNKVTLEECMEVARKVNSDETSNQIVVCLPLLEKTNT